MFSEGLEGAVETYFSDRKSFIKEVSNNSCVHLRHLQETESWQLAGYLIFRWLFKAIQNTMESHGILSLSLVA